VGRGVSQTQAVMAGLDPATQPSRDSAMVTQQSLARTDVRALGGRLKAGHDDFGRGGGVMPCL
jgi:hypothetical protein